jgi:type III secretion protein J
MKAAGTRRAAACVLLAAALAACSETELYGNLSQRHANEMTAVLRSAGIDADKVARDAGQYAVVVPGARFSEAVEVLKSQGYPREGYDTLGQVFKKEGFVSSPLEERARLQHALSQELANTLSSFSGVVMARVHLSVPERDALADRQPPSSASVYIKHRAGVDFTARVGQVKALVVNALPGLPYDNVTVALDAADPVTMPPAAPAAPLRSLGALLWTLIVAGAAAAAAGAGLGWWQRRRPAPRAGLPTIVEPS